MFEERMQQQLLGLTFSQRLADTFSQMLHVIWNKIGQIDILGPIPNLLIGIKFRCVCRKPFDGDSPPESPCQSLGCTAVYHPSVPDQNNAFRKVLQQDCDKRLHLLGSNVMAKQPEIKSQSSACWRNTDRRYNREPVSAVPTVLYRCLTARCPSASDNRLEHKAAFVSKNDGSIAFSGVFLSAASRSLSMIQSHLRRVRGPAVRVSGSSSPSAPAYAKRPTHRMLCQNAFVSQRLLATVSTVRWHIRAFRGLEAKAFRVASTGWRSAWADGRCAVSLSGHRGHIGDMPLSTVKSHRLLPRNAWLPLSPTTPVPATSWPRAGAAPCSCMTLYFSYKTLSAKPYCFSELFNVQ
jgi:hypothetical protein